MVTWQNFQAPVIPPSHRLNWYQGSLSGEKKLGPEVDHSPPSSTKVKNKWSYTSTPPICLRGKYRDNFKLHPFTYVCMRNTSNEHLIIEKTSR